MKKAIRFLALILSLITVLSVGFVGCGEKEPTGEPIDTAAEYLPLVGVQNEWIVSNPDRGYRTEICLRMTNDEAHYNEIKDDWRNIYALDSDEELNKKIRKIVDMYLPPNNKLAIAYISFAKINRAEAVPDEYLHVLDLFFDYCREIDIKILWRHAYAVPTNKYIANPEDKAYLATVCADEETMIRHIKQLGTYISKHTDVIQKVSSGVIGNGEFVASFQWPPVDFNNVLDALVRYMCVPNGLQMSIRMPRYKKDLLDFWKEEHGEDYPYADIIGFNNDAVFGETDKPNFHSGCWQYNHKDCGPNCFNRAENYFDEWAYVSANAAYTSQSGEMFVNAAMIGPNLVPTGLSVIKQVAHHRYTTLSNWHTLYETQQDNVMKRWIESESVTPELLDQNGIIYDPNWFKDVNGGDLHRNPYEFIRDHLGYKLVAEKSTLKGQVGKGTKLTVDMSFKNYGFAAPFFLESGYAVLDSKYNVVATVKAGEPDKWISLPADYYAEEKKASVQNDIITHNVSAELTLPEESGKYFIAFYLKNSMDDFASLSNDIPFEDGYNILHEIEIK